MEKKTYPNHLNREQRLILWRREQAKLSNHRTDIGSASFDTLPVSISNYEWLGGRTLEPLKAISDRVSNVTQKEVSNSPDVAYSILQSLSDLLARLAYNLGQEQKMCLPSSIKSFSGQLICSITYPNGTRYDLDTIQPLEVEVAIQLTLTFQLRPMAKSRSRKTLTEMLVDVKGEASAKDETIRFSVGFYSPDSEMTINTGPVYLESIGGTASGEAQTTLFMPDTPGDKEFWIQLFQLGRLVYARRIEVRVKEATSKRTP